MIVINKEKLATIKYYTNNIDKNRETIIFIHHAFGDHRAFDDQMDFFVITTILLQ